MQNYPDGFRFQQVIVAHEQLPRLRRLCKKNRVLLVEDVKAADRDIAKQKRPGTTIVALNGRGENVAKVHGQLPK